MELANDPHNEALIVSQEKANKLEAKGGYAYHYKIKTILTKFGLRPKNGIDRLKHFRVVNEQKLLLLNC